MWAFDSLEVKIFVFWMEKIVARGRLKIGKEQKALGDGMFFGRLVVAGAPRPVLVRVSTETSSSEGLAQLREDVGLLRRVRHEHVLAVEHATSVKKRLAVVYSQFKGANLAACLASSSGEVPVRAALELVAAVALGLDAVSAVEALQPDRRLFHTGPTPQDVLLDAVGRVKVVGCRVHTVGRDIPARAPGYADSGEPVETTALTFGIASLLLEILCNERAGDLSSEELEGLLERARAEIAVVAEETVVDRLMELLRRSLCSPLEKRIALATLAQRLDALSNEVSTRGLRSWASFSVPRASRKNLTEASSAARDEQDAFSDTIPRDLSERFADEEETQTAAVPGAGDDPLPELATLESLDAAEGVTALYTQALESEDDSPKTELISQLPPRSESEDWTQPRRTELMPSEDAADLTVPRTMPFGAVDEPAAVTRDLSADEVIDSAAPNPSPFADFDAATVAEIAPDGPSVLGPVSMAIDDEGPSFPARFEIDTSSEAFVRERQAERTGPAARRPLWPAIAAVVGALLLGVWWLQGTGEESTAVDVSPVSIPSDDGSSPGIESLLPAPSETKPLPTEEAPAASSSSTTVPVAEKPPVVTPTAPTAAPSGVSTTPSPVSGPQPDLVPAATAAPFVEEAPASDVVDDTDPVVPESAEVDPPSAADDASEAASERTEENPSASGSVWDGLDQNSVDRATEPQAANPVETAPAPAEQTSEGFRVEFVSANPDVTEIVARCHVGSGADPQRVVLENADTGPCRVEGRLASGRPLITAVVIKESATFICFAGGVASCR